MAQRTKMRCEIDGLKEAFTLARGGEEAALWGQAVAAAELASLQGQVRGAASLVEEATDEAREARGLQLQHSKMFQGLDRRARRALGFICTGSVPRPLVPDEAGYLDFFTKVMERLEAGAQQVWPQIKEESCDLLSQVLTRVFSNLFHIDPHFDFEVTMASVLEASHDALGKAVKGHVDALSV
ncbi:hypothetical protein D1007_05993 [Hordeum vulgare]|nr:hypothetical protein D1007_05993 [Hordeum vulgare]